VLAAVALTAACTSAPAETTERRTGTDADATGTSAPRPPLPRDLQPYAGLGAWIDVFDYAPAYQDGGVPPPLSPDDIDDMARRGVRTLYLQATRWDDRSPDGIVDAELIGRFLQRAHDAGMRVVGWYLPRFVDVALDVERSIQILDLDVGGERFDGLAIDIEYTEGEPDHVVRNANLVAYSQALHDRVGEVPIGAVVLSPVHLEVVNPAFWPEFPYQALRPLYDVWLPMSYWTVRTGEWADGERYTRENVARLRANLGEPLLVAPVGGIADEATEGDLAGFARAVRDGGAIGGSVYDWTTMAPGKQALLRELFSTGAASSLTPVPSG
jgi:hypothetical protein